VNEMDGRLRDLLEAAVGEPPHRLDLTAVRRRVRRRRGLESAAAATAVVLAAGTGVAVAAGVSGPGPSSAAARAGVPAYYVQQATSGSAGTGPLVATVRETATGAVTATVRCPRPGTTIPARAIAPAAHGTFFVVCARQVPWGTGFTQAAVYRFRLTPAGHVAGFSPVPGGRLGIYGGLGLAVTPGGSLIAVALGPPAVTDSARASDPSGGIAVIDARTGVQTLWRNDPAASGMIFTAVDWVSLTANGHELAFQAFVHCLHRGHAGCQAGFETREVTPTLGGELTSSRMLLDQSHLAGQPALECVMITPNGSALTLVTVDFLAHGQVVSVVQVSPVSGRQLAVLYRVTGEWPSYRYVSADPTGRYLMIDAGGRTEPVNGWIYHGKLIPLTPRDGMYVRYQAW
jgi:hypothetical protein